MPPIEKVQDQKDAEMLSGLAEIHLLFGQHGTALDLLELANWIAPNRIPTLSAIARCHFHLSSPRRVIDILDQISTLDPTHQHNPNDALLRAKSHALLGEIEAAKSILQVMGKKNINH